MGNADLPVASGRAHARAFERAGWQQLQRRGRKTHILLRKPGHAPTLSIPDHREVKRALLAAQIKLAGLSTQEYLKLFNR